MGVCGCQADGMSAMFSCEQGFTLDGQEDNLCQPDGFWLDQSETNMWYGVTIYLVATLTVLFMSNYLAEFKM
ncbi:hypothetical protein DPMN_113980 [Dreissena polymorpha]|uniref:Sushi domain-containing protein n=1 Tax=Dreissena polymorpha TaxID=45954 RepID=A0A9D4KIE2_DREPO|nr:hypothetical protein DPMN_113980 [Dreissena polymorpha]